MLIPAVPLVCLVSTVLSAALPGEVEALKKSHTDTSHLTCGYANASIELQFDGKHKSADVVVYKFSEVESHASRLLPWDHSSILTCRLHKGHVKCHKHFGNGTTEKYVPGPHSTVYYDAVSTKHFAYPVVERGFYCTNVTIVPDGMFPFVKFNQGPMSAWHKAMSIIGVTLDMLFNGAMFLVIWKSLNHQTVNRNANWKLVVAAMGCLLGARVLAFAQHFYFNAGYKTIMGLTHGLSGVVKGLGLSLFTEVLLLLSFEITSFHWMDVTKLAAPVCVPVFLLTYIESVLVGSHIAPRVPLYYPEGYRWCMPVQLVLVASIVGGFFTFKSQHTLIKGPQQILSTLITLIGAYVVFWVAVTMRTWIGGVSYLDSSASPPMLTALHVFEWFLKAFVPALALWALATRERGGEAQRLLSTANNALGTNAN